MKILFQARKNNRYSIIPLLSALARYSAETAVGWVERWQDTLTYPPTETIVAYSFNSMDRNEVREEISALKRYGYTIIAGGAHVTAMPDDGLQMGADYVFIGDGEKNLLRFMQGYRPDNYIFDGKSERIDLNDYTTTYPALSLFMPIEISRGCPYSCAYCQAPDLMGRKTRHKSVRNVLEEAGECFRSGKKVARFITPNAFGYLSENPLEPNCEAIENLLNGLRAIGFTQIYFGSFPSDVRPESVTAEVVKLVRKYCINPSIVIGAQSGSPRILQKIKRGHTVEQAETAICTIFEAGLVPHVDLIFGFPFEEEEDRIATFQFAERIIERYHALIHSHTFIPLPGTELFSAGAGRISPHTRTFLHKKRHGGVLDGYWKEQEEFARKMDTLYQEKYGVCID